MEALKSGPPPTYDSTKEVTNDSTKEVTNDSTKEVTEEIRDLSYEEEQLQQILIQESEKIKIIMDRELRRQQELEYEQSLKKDIEGQGQGNQEDQADQEIKGFHEPSLEEMRETRLKRFSK